MPTTDWNVQAGGNATETIGGELQILVDEATAAQEAAEDAKDAAVSSASTAANAAEQAEAFGKIYTETDAELLSVTIPPDVDVVQRMPSVTGQVAPQNIVTRWRRNASPGAEDFWTDAAGANFTIAEVTQGEIVSILNTAIDALADEVGTWSFADRASALVWIGNNPTPRVGTLVQWDGVAVRYVGSGTAIADMPGYVPDGDVYADHWGASTSASAATNLAAIQAALNSSYGTINLFTTGVYQVGGQLRYTGFSKVLQGAGCEFATLNFTDTFDGPCILFEPSDPLEDTLRSNNGLMNLSLTGNASARTDRWAMDIRKQQSFRLDNVRWDGFSFGLRVAGGQLNTFTRFFGFSSGRDAGAHLAGSTQIMLAPAANTSGSQPCYTCSFDNFTLSGGANKNIQDIITLVQSDGANFSNYYIAFGQRSLIRLEQISGQNITATMFGTGYFDGVGTVTGTPHWISAKDDAAVGHASIMFNNVTSGNFSGDIFDLDVDNNIRLLQFIGGSISSSATGLGTIAGVSTADGLRLMFQGTTLRNCPGALSVTGAAVVDADANFYDISDATGTIKLSGTIRQKRLALTFTDCADGLVDTSTGQVEFPAYEWYEQDSFVPSVRIGANVISNPGHSVQLGQYTRVGRLVTFEGQVAITTLEGRTGDISVILPFTKVGSVNSPVFCFPGSGAALAIGVVISGGDVIGGTNRFRIQKISTNGAAPLTNADISTTFNLRFSGSYWI